MRTDNLIYVTTKEITDCLRHYICATRDRTDVTGQDERVSIPIDFASICARRLDDLRDKADYLDDVLEYIEAHGGLEHMEEWLSK